MTSTAQKLSHRIRHLISADRGRCCVSFPLTYPRDTWREGQPMDDRRWQALVTRGKLDLTWGKFLSLTQTRIQYLGQEVNPKTRRVQRSDGGLVYVVPNAFWMQQDHMGETQWWAHFSCAISCLSHFWFSLSFPSFSSFCFATHHSVEGNPNNLDVHPLARPKCFCKLYCGQGHIGHLDPPLMRQVCCIRGFCHCVLLISTCVAQSYWQGRISCDAPNCDGGWNLMRNLQWQILPGSHQSSRLSLPSLF